MTTRGRAKRRRRSPSPKRAATIKGGCLCGTVRYAVRGRPTTSMVCHCRTCRHAAGSPAVAWVTFPAAAFTMVRGRPAAFHSTRPVTRTFCARCGTPLTYEYEGGVEVAIGALDEPARAAPVIQVNPAGMLPFFDGLHELPFRKQGDSPAADEFMRSVVGHQHPDHDTETWPPEDRS